MVQSSLLKESHWYFWTNQCQDLYRVKQLLTEYSGCWQCKSRLLARCRFSVVLWLHCWFKVMYMYTIQWNNVDFFYAGPYYCCICLQSVYSQSSGHSTWWKETIWAEVDWPLSLFLSGVLEPKQGIEEYQQVLFARLVACPKGIRIPVRASASPVTLWGYVNHKFSGLSLCLINHAVYTELPLSSESLDISSGGKLHADLGVDTSSMGQHQKAALDELLQKFADVFSTKKFDLGRTFLVHYRINTGIALLVKQPLP